MLKIAALCLGLIVVGFDLGQAQDIAGIEDCTKTTGLDKRTGCLQSNVNVLQQLITKNVLDARLQARHDTLEGGDFVVGGVEQLQAAQKAATDKKPETK